MKFEFSPKIVEMEKTSKVYFFSMIIEALIEIKITAQIYRRNADLFEIKWQIEFSDFFSFNFDLRHSI